MASATGHEITVNGRRCALDGTDPSTTALDWLRDRGLTGAKEGCAEGECGACSIMVARPDGGCGHPVDRHQRLPRAGRRARRPGGRHLRGPGPPEPSTRSSARWRSAAGRSAATARPGFICSMAAEYYRGRPRAPTRRRRPPVPDAAQRRPPAGSDREAREHEDAAHEHGPNGFDLHALSGNLCRCTGYRPIRDAAYALGEPGRRRPVCRAAGRRAARRRARPGSTAPPGPTPGRATSPRRWPCWPSTPTPSSSPGRPTGASRSTSAARGRPSPSASTGCPSCAPSTIGEDSVEIGAALSLSEVERGLGGPDPVAGPDVPAVRLPADPQRRHHRRQPRHRLARSATPPPALLALEAVVVLASRRRRARGPARRLLHRLPADASSVPTS